MGLWSWEEIYTGTKRFQTQFNDEALRYLIKDYSGPVHTCYRIVEGIKTIEDLEVSNNTISSLINILLIKTSFGGFFRGMRVPV